mmetsp:Transcript_52078/g.129728  ORF Transcript_52078/g.129728 Transcript_52078/m.129728 type:complete len:217 (-) Transcript_52078:260-910(-)
MREETAAAAKWWADCIFKNGLQERQVAIFRRDVEQSLKERCQGHWYEENLQQGSGYRSVVHDARVDPVLENAAINAGIPDIEHRLPRAVMWVNPGEVKFTQFAVGDLSEQKSIVYSTEKAHSSPKEWDPAFIESHKPFVVDQSEVGGGWTPPAGSGPSKEAVARFELARAVRNSAKTNGAPGPAGLYQIGRVGTGNPRAMHIGINGVSNNAPYGHP